VKFQETNCTARKKGKSKNVNLWVRRKYGPRKKERLTFEGISEGGTVLSSDPRSGRSDLANTHWNRQGRERRSHGNSLRPQMENRVIHEQKGGTFCRPQNNSPRKKGHRLCSVTRGEPAKKEKRSHMKNGVVKDSWERKAARGRGGT